MEKINAISTLRYLQISYSTVTDLVELNVESIEELYIDHSNLHHLNFLLQLPNLKRLSIDEKQYNNNLDTIEKIKSRNVLVLEDNMVEFGGDHQ